MKKINFIDTIPENIHRETQLWLIGTTLFCACSFIGIILVNIAQLPELYSVYQKLTQLTFQQKNSSSPEEHTQLQSTHKKLSTAVNTLRKTSQNNNSPVTYLDAIHTACSGDVHLERVQLNKKNIALSVSCSKLQNLSACTASLKRDIPNLETLTVTNVQTNHSVSGDTRFNCTVKGTFTQTKKV